MKREIDPETSPRAQAFELWMASPMPMVTMVKTMNISHLLSVCQRGGIQFNMLMCYCIGKAASGMEEFFLLPEGGKLYRYDSLAINVIVKNCQGGINSCDIPYTDDIQQFGHNYSTATTSAANNCESYFSKDHIIIGTSAMVQTELDCIVNQYTDKFCNPMVMWGKYRKRLIGATLPISFQFHHVQMDGGHATHFLQRLQEEMNVL